MAAVKVSTSPSWPTKPVSTMRAAPRRVTAVSQKRPGSLRPDSFLPAHPTGKVAVVERELPLAWAGKKLGALNEPGRFWLTAVTRLGSARIAKGDMVGQEGDVLSFMAATDALDGLRERLASGKDH